MNTNGLKDLIHEAQEHLNEAIGLLETYVRETDDLYAEAYMVDQLKILVGSNHGFLCSDLNLDDLLEQLNEREPDEEVYEDEEGF